GGGDLLLVETIFDTLNAKAAAVALEEVFDDLGHRLPVMVSVTVPDNSGRTLSGQTVDAFWISMMHTRPLTIGINCGLGAEQMRPHMQSLSRIAAVATSCYPNAGLPNAFGEYDQSPEVMGQLLGDFASEGWVNMIGGCCGTTPAHIRAIADQVRDHAPRQIPEVDDLTRYSGLEPCVLRPELGFVMVGERTNVTGSKRFERLIKNEN